MQPLDVKSQQDIIDHMHEAPASMTVHLRVVLFQSMGRHTTRIDSCLTPTRRFRAESSRD